MKRLTMTAIRLRFVCDHDRDIEFRAQLIDNESRDGVAQRNSTI
jgi:hypothetical protein